MAVWADGAVSADSGRLVGHRIAPPRQVWLYRSVEYVVVTVAATALAFYRLGSAGRRGALWAEDGTVFLGQAYHMGPFHSLFEPYAGYLSTVQRIIASAISLLPVATAGVAMHLAAALIEGLCAMVAYLAARDIMPMRWARIVLAAYVVMVPVGPEVTGNLANLQWFLVVAATLCLFWRPYTRAGTTIICLTMLAATTTSPFGFVLLVGALVRWYFWRRTSRVIAAATAVGVVIQIIGMIYSPPRPKTTPSWNIADIVRGYNNRVLGDSVFGVGRFNYGDPRNLPIEHDGLFAGLLVLALLAILVLLTTLQRDWPALRRAGALIAFSIIFYVMPAILSAVPVNFAWQGGRYYTTPAMLLIAALLTLGVATISPSTTLHSRAGITLGFGALASLLLVIAVAVGLVTSYLNGDFSNRNKYPSWGHEVLEAQKSCVGKPAATTVKLEIAPVGWDPLVLRCDQLD